MTAFDAVYFDGRSSARANVRVEANNDILHLYGADLDLRFALIDVHADARIGDAPRTLQLPGGAQLQTADHAAITALFPRAHPFEARVQRLERHWGIALTSVAVIAATAWWFTVHAIPLAANAVARAVPQDAQARLGRQTLAALDAGLCSASTLSEARKQSILRLFDQLTAGNVVASSLAFRACPAIGPNAYALPGGSIVLIDELVELAANDREVAAVLAHEIGHVQEHHSLRLALQGAGVVALISMLAGDAVSITGMAVTLPTLLLQTAYTREFETAADSFAFARLKAIGLSPNDFADAMTRLEAYQRSHNAGGGEKGPRPLDYLSTHPDTAQRIERARNYR